MAPLAGTDGLLASTLKDDVIARFQQLTGKDIKKDEYLAAFCQAISETILAHIITNALVYVPAGVAVQVDITTGIGATTAPGIGVIK